MQVLIGGIMSQMLMDASQVLMQWSSFPFRNCPGESWNRYIVVLSLLSLTPKSGWVVLFFVFRIVSIWSYKNLLLELQVWAVADVKRQGFLGFKEFVTAMQACFASAWYCLCWGALGRIILISLSHFLVNMFLGTLCHTRDKPQIYLP